jgi:hypothetical protein
VLPILFATLSNYLPIPYVSLVPSYRYQPNVYIPTVVITPPKHPYFYIISVCAPARLDAIAADKPAGPPPTTIT